MQTVGELASSLSLQCCGRFGGFWVHLDFGPRDCYGGLVAGAREVNLPEAWASVPSEERRLWP